MHVTLYEVPEDSQLLVWWLYDFTNLLCKSVSVMRDLFWKNKISFEEEAIGNIIKSSYKSTVGSEINICTI